MVATVLSKLVSSFRMISNHNTGNKSLWCLAVLVLGVFCMLDMHTHMLTWGHKAVLKLSWIPLANGHSTWWGFVKEDRSPGSGLTGRMLGMNGEYFKQDIATPWRMQFISYKVEDIGTHNALKGAGGNLWSYLSLFWRLGCPVLFRVFFCSSRVLYFGITHYTQPNPRLEYTVKCSLHCYSTSQWIFQTIKSRYGWQWAILKFWVTFVPPVRRNNFSNESTSFWTIFPNVHWLQNCIEIRVWCLYGDWSVMFLCEVKLWYRNNGAWYAIDHNESQ